MVLGVHRVSQKVMHFVSCFGFYRKETCSLSERQCFSAGGSPHSSVNLAVWRDSKETHRPSGLNHNRLTLKLLKANPDDMCRNKKSPQDLAWETAILPLLSETVFLPLWSIFCLSSPVLFTLLSNAPQTSVSFPYARTFLHFFLRHPPVICMLLNLLWQVSKFTNRFPHGNKHRRSVKIWQTTVY